MKKYWQFIKESRDAEIHNICNRYKIKNYTINEDGSIDVDGDVNVPPLDGTTFASFPLKFRNIKGDFTCSFNGLTSLKGGPETVDGYIYVGGNKLTTMEGFPKKVGGIGCAKNNLTTLKGMPGEIDGSFYCSYNNLTTLEGGPKKVGGIFDCSENELITLEGGPKEVGGHFDCYSNKLTSLKGGPERVYGEIDFSDNPLITLEGFPSHFNPDGLVDLSNTTVSEVYDMFNDPKAIELMNDYGLINPDTMEVSYTILEEISEALGRKPSPFEDIKFKHYTLVE